MSTSFSKENLEQLKTCIDFYASYANGIRKYHADGVHPADISAVNQAWYFLMIKIISSLRELYEKIEQSLSQPEKTLFFTDTDFIVLYTARDLISTVRAFLERNPNCGIVGAMVEDNVITLAQNEHGQCYITTDFNMYRNYFAFWTKLIFLNAGGKIG